jgi:ribosomal protein S18 acetylase RimI-like enzyme
MVIRPFRITDLRATVELYCRCFAEPPWFEQFDPREVQGDFLRVMQGINAILLVAEDAGAIRAAAVAFDLMGKGDVFQIVPETYREALYMSELFVDPAARRQGVGRKLTDERLRLGRDRGYACAVARTSANQPIIQEMYARRGFQRVAEQDVLSCKMVNGQACVVADHRLILAGSI